MLVFAYAEVEDTIGLAAFEFKLFDRRCYLRLGAALVIYRFRCCYACKKDFFFEFRPDY